jgi:hypothetical protein
MSCRDAIPWRPAKIPSRGRTCIQKHDILGHGIAEHPRPTSVYRGLHASWGPESLRLRFRHRNRSQVDPTL